MVAFRNHGQKLLHVGVKSGGFGATCTMSLLWSEMIVMSWCFEKKREKKLDG